jgi:hypothetical protein
MTKEKNVLKRCPQILLFAVAMSIGGLAMSCGGGASVAAQPPKVTYKCLLSSCNATTVCNEGDPVPEHHGKPMIR